MVRQYFDQECAKIVIKGQLKWFLSTYNLRSIAMVLAAEYARAIDLSEEIIART